jgi:5-methylcytosine-specific restriction endonuclease McrA
MEKKIKEKFYSYKSRSKRSKIKFQLTYDQFKFLCLKECWYCKTKDELNPVGVDRLDPKKGYTTDNVAPCCWTCNRAKSNMSRLDFYKYRQKFNKQKYKIVPVKNSFRRFKEEIKSEV